MNQLYRAILDVLVKKTGVKFESYLELIPGMSEMSKQMGQGETPPSDGGQWDENKITILHLWPICF